MKKVSSIEDLEAALGLPPSGFTRLWRGTKELVTEHEPVWGPRILEDPTSRHRPVELALEAIRKQSFPNLPSRLESTFWTKDPNIAKHFGTYFSSTLVKTSKIKEFSQDVFTEAMLDPDPGSWGQSYWSGANPDYTWEQREVLLQGRTKPESIWKKGISDFERLEIDTGFLRPRKGTLKRKRALREQSLIPSSPARRSLRPRRVIPKHHSVLEEAIKVSEKTSSSIKLDALFQQSQQEILAHEARKNVVAWDIETHVLGRRETEAFGQEGQWHRYGAHAGPFSEEAKRHHRVVSVASARFSNEKVDLHFGTSSPKWEKELLEKFDSAYRPKDVYVGWNSKRYDTLVHANRIKKHALSSKVAEATHIDLMELMKKALKRVGREARPYTLESIAADLGLKDKAGNPIKKIKLPVEGSKIYTLAKDNPELFKKYATADVDLLLAIEKKTNLVANFLDPNVKVNWSALEGMRQYQVAEKAKKYWASAIDKGAEVYLSGESSQGKSYLSQLISGRRAGKAKGQPLELGDVAWIVHPERVSKKTGILRRGKMAGVLVNWKGKEYRFDFQNNQGAQSQFRTFQKHIAMELGDKEAVAEMDKMAKRRRAFRELRIAQKNKIAQEALHVAQQEVPAGMKDLVSSTVKTVGQEKKLALLHAAAPYAVAVAIGGDILASREKAGPVWGGVAALGAAYLTKGTRGFARAGIIAGAYAVTRLIAGSIAKHHNAPLNGFEERGESAIGRKQLTEFGSGWDPMRRFIGKLGNTLEEVLGHADVKKAFDLALAEEGEIIGHGGMGVAYLHTANIHGEKIKFISKTSFYGEEFLGSMAQEMGALRKMQDFSGATVYSSHVKTDLKGNAFYLMEYFEGKSLSEAVDEGYRVGAGQIKQIEESLGALHKSGMYHGDLKYHNAILTHEGNIGLIDPYANRYSGAEEKMDKVMGSLEVGRRIGQAHDIIALNAMKQGVSRQESAVIANAVFHSAAGAYPRSVENGQAISERAMNAILRRAGYSPGQTLRDLYKKGETLAQYAITEPPKEMNAILKQLMADSSSMTSGYNAKKLEGSLINEGLDVAAEATNFAAFEVPKASVYETAAAKKSAMKAVLTAESAKMGSVERSRHNAASASSRIKTEIQDFVNASEEVNSPTAWESRRPKSVPGFSETGISKTLREDTTDFGSPKDKAKMIAKLIGIAGAEKMGPHITRDPRFKKLLLGGSKGRSLGKGGIGEVFEYTSNAAGKEFKFAVKDYFLKGKSIESVLGKARAEANVLDKMKDYMSPTPYGISVIEEGGEKKVRLFMEIVPGAKTLSQVAKEGRGILPSKKAAIKEALDAGHEAGIIHSDLSPSNIVEDSDRDLWLLDYFPERYSPFQTVADSMGIEANFAKIAKATDQAGIKILMNEDISLRAALEEMSSLRNHVSSGEWGEAISKVSHLVPESRPEMEVLNQLGKKVHVGDKPPKLFTPEQEAEFTARFKRRLEKLPSDRVPPPKELNPFETVVTGVEIPSKHTRKLTRELGEAHQTASRNLGENMKKSPRGHTIKNN